MHLKTLSLAGFKSFADRTRIECEPGVTVVVGPNGSGKSNIVDAIAWVMGTQATSTLRTQKMEDVIFAGTAVRPALGRAEVSLTLDNSSGGLGLDLPEVTVTRRLFRDGTSEYEINGTPCRLLDIQEMLGDSGVGRHQHVLVGQGRVDNVLNAGPEEHRTVIEEAAGVIKHRHRRDRSIRRLEATDVDMERLNDLLAEQHRLMRPLKRQAKAAERYQVVKAEWRALRLWLGGERIRAVRGRLAEIDDTEQRTRRELDAAMAERAQITASLGGLQAAAGETGDALDRDTSAAARLETTSERLQRITLVARERRLGLERRVVGANERKRDLEAERAHLTTQIAEAEAEERAASESAERLAITVRALEDEARSLAETDRLPADGVAASLQGDLSALEAAAVRDDRESVELARRRGAVAAVIDEEQQEADRLQVEREVAAARLAAAEAGWAEARDQVGVDGDQAVITEEAMRAAERDVAAAAARVEALEAASAGLADPETRAAAAAVGGVVGRIAARLDIPPDLAAPADAALGAWADAFVTADHTGVVGAASTIKDSGRGGVAFVAPVAGGTIRARAAVADVAGVDALADRLGPSADMALAATVLGDVVIAGDWTAAVEIVSANPDVRAVTPEGDLVTAAGIVAAHPEGAGPAVIEAARAAADRAETERARAASRYATSSRALQNSRRAADDAETAYREASRVVSAIDETLGRLERSMAERHSELGRLDARARALAQAAATRAERMAGVRSRLAGLESVGDDMAALEDLARRREEIARRREDAEHRRQTASSTAAAAAERRALMESRLAEITTLFDVTDEPADPVALDRLTRVEERATRARRAVRSHIDALRERQRMLRSEAGEAGERLEAARRRRDELGEAIEQAREVVSSLNVEQAELRVRAESIAEGLRRDVDVDEETALAAPRPEIEDDADPAELVEVLEARLKRLGPVNPLAAAEFEELEERAGFLESQLADLDESRTELRKVIAALDEEIGRLFLAAFEEIASNFAENFAILFPGGTGRISLSNPDDPLTTGVEIFAQPMGKKVDRLQLLSGGERSLAALAFLFAVFRSRPSPFYVLDEVEAALDDANLRRFLRLVGTLRDTSQLLIVTHQQQTMEVADVLYGVTMEPGESSHVIAKRMTEVVASA